MAFSKEGRCRMPLPEHPDLDWLRKQAKHRLEEIQKTNPDAQLADAQFALAKELGFSSWRALKTHIDGLTIDGQVLAAARDGDVAKLTALLEQHPEKLHASIEAVRMAAAARSGEGPPAGDGGLSLEARARRERARVRRQHVRDALGGGNRRPRRRPASGRRRRRRRRSRRRPSARGDRLGLVLGRHR